MNPLAPTFDPYGRRLALSPFGVGAGLQTIPTQTPPGAPQAASASPPVVTPQNPPMPPPASSQAPSVGIPRGDIRQGNNAAAEMRRRVLEDPNLTPEQREAALREISMGRFEAMTGTSANSTFRNGAWWEGPSGVPAALRDQNIVASAATATSPPQVAAENTSAAVGEPPAASPPSPQPPVPNMLADAPQGASGPMGWDPGMLALAGGLLSGRNPMESLGNAATNLAQAQNQDRRLRFSQAETAEARAIRRAQLDVQRQQARTAERRADNEERRADSAAQGRYQTVGTFQDADGRQMVIQNHSVTGEVRTVPLAEGVQRAQDANRTLPEQRLRAQSNQEFSDSVYQQSDSARGMRQIAADVRAILAENPNITGASWRQQLGRALAMRLGIPVDGKSPQDIEALMFRLTGAEQAELIRMSPILRPLSNTDVPTILRAVPGLMSDPRNVQTWVDQLDREADRLIQRERDFSRMVNSPEEAARYGRSGYRNWDADWRANYEQNRRPRTEAPAPSIQRDGDGWTTVPTGGGGNVRIRVIQ